MSTTAAVRAKRRLAPPTGWRTHFQALSGAPASASFGAFLGSHTIDELKDLVNAKDDELKNLAEVSASYLPAWRSRDPAAAAAWQSDYAKFKSDYAAARASAQDAIDKAAGKGAFLGMQLTPDSINTSGDTAYKLLLQAINPGMNQSAASNRLVQLRNRLQAAGATMTEYFVRQPVYTKELGTQFTQATQPIVDAADRAGHKLQTGLDTAKYTLWAVLGGVFVLAIVLVKALAPEAGSIAKAYLPPPPHS
jgi:hypothetical protein